MPKAARLGDPLAHTSALAGLVGGALAGAVIGAALVLTVASGGLAAPVLIGAMLTGAAVGAWIGEFLGSLSFLSPVTGAIAATCSPNVFINGLAAARAMIDQGQCSKHGPGPHLIVQGSRNVFINGYPAARLDDHLACGAFIKDGSPNVYIGGGQQTCAPIDADVPEWAHAAVMAAGVTGALLLGGWAVVPSLLGAFALGYAGGEILGALGKHFGPWLSDHVGGLPSDWEKGGQFTGQAVGGWLGARGATVQRPYDGAGSSNEVGGCAGGAGAPSPGGAKSYGVAFFGDSNLGYYTRDGATLGRAGKSFFMMPLEDSAVVKDASDAALYTGRALSAEEAYLNGGEIYGLSFPTDGMNIAQPTAADAAGWPHFLEGGNTAVRLGDGPSSGYLVNPTREFVIPGGSPVPSGSVLFQLGPNGEWMPIKRF